MGKEDDLTRLEDISEFQHPVDNSEEAFDLPPTPPLPENDSFFDSPPQPAPEFDNNSQENSELHEDFSGVKTFDSQELSDTNEDNKVYFSDNNLEEQQFNQPTNESFNDPQPPPKKEDFEEIKEFVDVKNEEANPPYALLIQGNLNLHESRILETLKEFKILSDSNESAYKLAITQGRLIVSQLSELTAILIAHKLRDLEISLTIDFNESIISSDIYTNNRGFPLIDNSRSEHFDNIPASFQEVLVTRSSILPGINVVKHIGLITVEHIVDEEDFMKIDKINIDDESTSPTKIAIDLLKKNAFSRKANGVIDVQFQFIKLIKNFKIVLTGNAVLMAKSHGQL